MLTLLQERQRGEPHCILLPLGEHREEHSCWCRGDSQLLNQGEHSHLWDAACPGPYHHCEGALQQQWNGQRPHPARVETQVILHPIHRGPRRRIWCQEAPQGWAVTGPQALMMMPIPLVLGQLGSHIST